MDLSYAGLIRECFPNNTSILDNGSTRLEMGGDIYCIIPKGYKCQNNEGFFDITRNLNYGITDWTIPGDIPEFEQVVSDLDLDLSSVRKHALYVENLNCLKDVYMYFILTNAHIVGVTMTFEDFMGNSNYVSSAVYNNILCIEGLDADVESGTAGIFHITPEELFPVFMSSMAFNTTRFKNVIPKSNITCYFISAKLANYLAMKFRTIGRFDFASGMLSLKYS